jgi:hypothetical protein
VNQRGLGRRPERDPKRDVHDQRYPFRAAASSRKERFWPRDGAWLDQDGYGTCVAFALSHRMADKPIYQERAHPDAFDPTESWAFELYRAATGDDSMQEGTWADIVAAELKRRGLIERYEWIHTPEDMVFALLERGPVAIGIPWFNSMFDTYTGQDGRQWIDVRPSSGLAGGHEVELPAIRLEPSEGRPWWRPFYVVKNSWGRWFGDDGVARLWTEDAHRLVFESWGDAIWLAETR